MKSKKATKRALLSSALSLVLCFSMLLGTTFAWFTDTASTGVNIIKSGTLDVELNYCDDGVSYVDASEKVIFDYKFWEPGYTEYKYVQIKNVGDLALRYRLDIIPVELPAAGERNLADVIDVYLFDAETTVSRDVIAGATPVGTLSELMADPDGAAHGVMLPIDGSSSGKLSAEDAAISVTGDAAYCIALKMQEDAGNEYQNLSVGEGFRVQLLATQLTYESDSFDNQYDADAEYYIVNESAAIVNNNGTLGEAVVFTADMPFGTMKVTVPAGAQLSSADVSSLKLTVKNAESNYSGQLAANQVATGYVIYVDGIADYLNPFVNAVGNKVYNYSDITVELPIGAGRTDVKAYKDGMMPSNTWASYDSDTGIVTFSADYFTPFSQAKKSNITVVYTKLSEAEKQLNETLENVTAGDSVTINSTADNMVSVNNIADALNGSSSITLAGTGAANTTVASNGATVTADSLTVKDMTIQSVGTTTIKGNNTTIEGVTYQSAGASYGLTVTGSDTTIKNTTVEGANATQGLVVITSGSDTTTSVTNVSGLTVTDISPFGSSSGFTFRNINGTVNLSDSTIKVRGAAFGFGPSNSTTRGYVNVSNTTFDSTSASISTVKASTFDTVVFDNTWSDSAISFTVGGATNTFTNCEFKADIDFQSANYANKNVTLIFNNCTYDGVAITAENIKDHFVFDNGMFGLQNRDKLTVIVNDVTVTL